MRNVDSNNRVAPATGGWWYWLTAPRLAAVMRVVIGGIFVVAGLSKLLLPHAEVVEFIQQYRVIPLGLTPLIASTLPWIEMLSGTALLIGFFTTPAALIVGLQLMAFCLLMVTILVLGIEIEDCGCFGNFGWQETPVQVLLRDLVMLAMLGVVLKRRGTVFAVDSCDDEA